MANLLSDISLFFGGVALGWYATKGVDWLLQRPMQPTEHPYLNDLLNSVDILVNDPAFAANAPSESELRQAWAKIVVPLSKVQSSVKQLREQNLTEQEADFLARLQAVIALLAMGPATPSDNFNPVRAAAHWFVAQGYLGPMKMDDPFPQKNEKLHQEIDKILAAMSSLFSN